MQRFRFAICIRFFNKGILEAGYLSNSSRFSNPISDILRVTFPFEVIAFYAAAYLGIIAHWIERGCPESSETMARIATRLLFIKPGESIEL